MRTKNIFLGLLFGIILSTFGQNNLIHNALLEQPVNVSSPFFPGLVDNYTPKEYFYEGGWNTINHGEKEGLSIWESRINPKTTILTEPGELPVKTQLILHSPDWYMINQFDGQDKFRMTESGDDIMPYAGKGYVGMGPGELIQQKFFDDNKFDEGKKYTLNFYVRTAREDDWTVPANLNVYLRKSKMRYSINANKLKNRCDPDKFYEKSNLNNTIKIVSQTINTSDFPIGEWRPITIEFIAPSSDFDWIVIETESENLCNAPYLLVDNFNLSKTCELDSCSKTSGIVNPNHNGIVSSTDLFAIDNLDNASSATIEILNIVEETIWTFTANCTNGITETIYWDGRDMLDNHVPFGYYLLVVNTTNECGTTSQTYTIAKTGNHIPYTNVINCNNLGIIVPKPCCVYQPDLIIDNTTFSGIESFDYEVINSIEVAPLYNVIVTNNSNVTMKAGYEININPGFYVETGGNYYAEIAPCTKSMSPNFVIGEIVSGENNTIEDELISLGKSISIYPNPTSESATLLLKGYTEGITYNIEIFNTQWQLIKSFETIKLKTPLAINSFKKGLYFVKISHKNNTETFKLIKQ